MLCEVYLSLYMQNMYEYVISLSTQTMSRYIPSLWPQAFRELDSDGSGEIEPLVLHVASLTPNFVTGYDTMILLDKCGQCIYIFYNDTIIHK